MKGAILIFIYFLQYAAESLYLSKTYSNENVSLIFNFTSNGANFEMLRDGAVKLTGTIGVGVDFDDLSNATFDLNISTVDDGISVFWESNDTSFVAYDCLNLDSSLHWFGGPQIYQQEWPIETLQLSGNDPYVVRKDSNFAVPERYWLSSTGTFIFVDETSPLYIDQNVENPGRVCFIGKVDGPYFNRTSLKHKYYLIAEDDPVAAHQYAVRNFLGHPQNLPNTEQIVEPIWTTWAKFKKDINDSMIREFVYEIYNHGFKGQIEIDEQWETCFGSRQFLPGKFDNISEVVTDIKNKGYRVTIWAAPFVNPDCTDLIEEGEANGYYVKNIDGDMSTVWWESTDARQIDFTNPEARKWYTDKLATLFQYPGVNGFKFDAGETDYVAQPAVYENVDQDMIPNIFTQHYINTVSQFGDLIEARSAFRTQNYTLLLRMIDKDSVWGLDDGLQSVVTTLLQLNMVGYSFILPDMIGGNGYRAQPSLELLIRWTQATVFMPAMQFSYLPWDFEDDDELHGTEIVKSMVDLHTRYTSAIVQAMINYIYYQVPVNPPIWWISPYDDQAMGIADEYLLGDNILVAPVLEEGATSRSIYLPLGMWVDGNNDSLIYTGPITIDYDAPLSVLPYFIKEY